MLSGFVYNHEICNIGAVTLYLCCITTGSAEAVQHWRLEHTRVGQGRGGGSGMLPRTCTFCAFSERINEKMNQSLWWKCTCKIFEKSNVERLTTASLLCKSKTFPEPYYIATKTAHFKNKTIADNVNTDSFKSGSLGLSIIEQRRC